MYVYGNIFDCRFPTHNFSGLESESRTLAQRILAILSSPFSCDCRQSPASSIVASIASDNLVRLRKSTPGGMVQISERNDVRKYWTLPISTMKLPSAVSARRFNTSINHKGNNIRKYEWKAERNW